MVRKSRGLLNTSIGLTFPEGVEHLNSKFERFFTYAMFCIVTVTACIYFYLKSLTNSLTFPLLAIFTVAALLIFLHEKLTSNSNSSSQLATSVKLADDPNSSELEKSAEAAKFILEGEDLVRNEEGFVGYWPVMLLGSGDLVGLITVSLKQRGRRPYILGRGDTLPLELLGRKCIVIDVSDQGTIEEYADKLWKGVIVLSKSRSPPSHKTTAQLKSLSIPMYFVTQRKLSIVHFFDSDYALTYPNGVKKSNTVIRKFG